MFITKKKHEELLKKAKAKTQMRLDEAVDLLQDEVTRNAALMEKLDSYHFYLEQIAAQRTPGANATVNRMAKLAEEAVSPTPAKFVEDGPQPEGTLAQLSRKLVEEESNREAYELTKPNTVSPFITYDYTFNTNDKT